jgi:hypothetical protein
MKPMVGIITDKPLKGAVKVKRVESKSYEKPRFKSFFCDEETAFQLRDVAPWDLAHANGGGRYHA